MKRRTRIVIYVGIVLMVYVGLLLTNVIPSMLWRGIRGPRGDERRIVTVRIESDYQRTPTRIRILAPKNMEAGRRYPVLYLLPSVPQILDPWWNSPLIEIIRFDVADRHQVICVAPTYSDMPWYADHPTDPKIRQESYLIKEIIPYIDANYPTMAEGRGRYLLGYSKSGTGAFTLLLRHPDLFYRALSWDAPMFFPFKEIPGSQLTKIYGTPENFRHYQLPILFRRRSADFTGPDPRFILMGFSENPMAIHRVHEYMNAYNITHKYDNTTQTRHNWHSGWFERAIGHLFDE